MKVEVACRHCNTLMRVNAEHIGKQVRCPNCQQLSLIEPTGSVDEEVIQEKPSWAESQPQEPATSWPQSPVYPNPNVQHGSTPHYIPGPAEPPYPAGYRTDGKDTLSLLFGGLAIASVFLCACFTVIITPSLRQGSVILSSAVSCASHLKMKRTS